MDKFIVSAPKDGWEQMCTLYESEGKYTIRLAANNCDDPQKAEILSSGESIKLSIPFEITGTADTVGAFKIESDSIAGLNNLMGAVAGKGSTMHILVSAPIGADPEDLGYTEKEGFLLYAD